MNERVRQLARTLLHRLEPLEPLTAVSADPVRLYPQLAAAIDECLAELRAMDIWGSDNRLPSSEIWNVAGHILCCGWLQNRARTKPRGYAGDYEMLARIYENRLCDHPLGQLFDRYFQEQAAPQAVRNRMAMMADWIVQLASRNDTRRNRVAIVGSAFGLEVRDALLRLDEAARWRLHLTLLDLDPDAVEFAESQLTAILPKEQLTALSVNLFRLAERPRAAETLRDANLLICPGLFDYLDDEAARAMLRCLFQQLAPRGRLTVFQFAPHNPTQAYMEWFANWYLIYRDAAQFQRVVDSAGLSAASITFGAEPLGIDLYVTVTRL